MARTIWVCTDGMTEISEVGRDLRTIELNVRFEYCFRCNNWDPTVVLAYR